MSRILLTGASGFIGRAVTSALVNDGHTIRVALRRSPQPPFPAEIEVIPHADLAHSVDWRPALEGVDQVVHLAGIAHGDRRIPPELYDRINRVATMELATAAAKASVNRFVLISSVSAQSGSTADHALSERDPPKPESAYGRSKLAAEHAVRSAGVPFTILRPTVLYGPGAKGNFALLWGVICSRCPLPVKSLVNRRSLLSIDNFRSALRFVLSSPNTDGETYLVADPGVPPRLAELVTTIRQARQRWPLVFPLPTFCVETPLRLLGRGDLWDRLSGNLVVDVTKLLAAGWQPAQDTLAGLASLVHSDEG
jgi:nucleoside-diphosphate-sugar epimerase